MSARVRRLIPVMMMAASAPGFAEAQDWVVSAAAGRLVNESLGGRVGTIGTTLSLGYEGPVSFYLAGGAPLDTSGVFWGAAGAGGRFVRGTSLSAGLDATADLVTFADASWDGSGWGSSIEIMPVARLARGMGAFELRSGIERYNQSFAGESFERTLHMSDARLTLDRGPLRMTGELRYARADDSDFPFAGVTADYAGPVVGAWASLGRWYDTEVSGSAWGIGAQLALAPVGAVFASYTQEGWDPLYRNQPRRSWNIGLSRRFGSTRGSSLLPDAPQIVNGAVTFTVTDAAASGPMAIAGDFTGWEVVAMEPVDGEWVVALPVPSGVHRYAFRDGNGSWFVPTTVPDRVDDGFGGVSAVLVIP